MIILIIIVIIIVTRQITRALPKSVFDLVLPRLRRVVQRMLLPDLLHLQLHDLILVLQLLLI